jgi:hypothetical protein
MASLIFVNLRRMGEANKSHHHVPSVSNCGLGEANESHQTLHDFLYQEVMFQRLFSATVIRSPVPVNRLYWSIKD